MAYGFTMALFASTVLLTYCDTELDDHKSLNEIIDATLNSKFDELFMGDESEASALAMLRYSIAETTIEPEYLTKVFYEAVGASSNTDLGEINFKLEEAVDMMNKVIKHFQVAPADAGRPTSPDETETEPMKMEL